MANGKGAIQEIKLGFWIGVGFLILGLILTVFQGLFRHGR